jgi:hypothetical protein
MPQRLLPRLTLSLFALLMLFPPFNSALADPGAAGLRATIDGYRVELLFPDGPPKAGPNSLLVRLHDPNDQPLGNSMVQVAAQSAGAGAHGHGGTDSHADAKQQDAHGDAPSTIHADTVTPEHADTHQRGTAAEQLEHSDSSSAQHTDSTPRQLTHDQDDQHIDTIMTQLERATELDTYSGVVHLDSPGAWQITVRFTHQDSDRTLAFAVSVPEPPTNWLLLGGFGGANALIIVAAGLLKRRSPTTAKRRRGAAPAHPEN